jgi:hypothetical protein
VKDERESPASPTPSTSNDQRQQQQSNDASVSTPTAQQTLDKMLKCFMQFDNVQVRQLGRCLLDVMTMDDWKDPILHKAAESIAKANWQHLTANQRMDTIHGLRQDPRKLGRMAYAFAINALVDSMLTLFQRDDASSPIEAEPNKASNKIWNNQTMLNMARYNDIPAWFHDKSPRPSKHQRVKALQPRPRSPTPPPASPDSSQQVSSTLQEQQPTEPSPPGTSKKLTLQIPPPQTPSGSDGKRGIPLGGGRNGETCKQNTDAATSADPESPEKVLTFDQPSPKIHRELVMAHPALAGRAKRICFGLQDGVHVVTLANMRHGLGEWPPAIPNPPQAEIRQVLRQQQVIEQYHVGTGMAEVPQVGIKHATHITTLPLNIRWNEFYVITATPTHGLRWTKLNTTRVMN